MGAKKAEDTFIGPSNTHTLNCCDAQVREREADQQLKGSPSGVRTRKKADEAEKQKLDVKFFGCGAGVEPEAASS